jgi:hypothetical protein
MVAGLPIVPLMQISKLGFRPCVRRDVCLPRTASCGTSLRVDSSWTGRPSRFPGG